MALPLSLVLRPSNIFSISIDAIQITETYYASHLGECYLCFNRSPTNNMSESTGMRCLPSTKLANADGNVLHDWHAETLAIRAFNRYLADECLKLASGTIQQAAIICRRKRSEAETSTRFRPFALRADVKLVMYCSETPCGDASMELVMEAQEDASPWPTEASTEQTSPLLGRGSFSQLGIVRRKPGISS